MEKYALLKCAKYVGVCYKIYLPFVQNFILPTLKLCRPHELVLKIKISEIHYSVI